MIPTFSRGFCNVLPLFAVAALVLVVGCKKDVAPPSYSPEAAAEMALEDYDSNKDQFLDATELRRCPALFESMAEVDKDRDGKLSKEEIQGRIEQYQQSGLGLISVTCTVYLDQVPLADAEVTLTPERFMGSSIKPAKGKSSDRGEVQLLAEGRDMAGYLPCGCYRIRVSKKNDQNELLPARYNTESILGKDISPDGRGSIVLYLSSQ